MASEPYVNERGLLKDKVTIVTGGSGGIGQATAVAFAQAGAHVVVHFYQGRNRALETVALCQDTGGQAIAVQGDLTQEDDVTGLFMAATELGVPTILVNNAGQAHHGLLMDTPLSVWQHILNVNLTSAFLCTRAAVPFLRREGGGRIVNVTSIHGLTGASNEGAYAASKAGMIALTKSAARELGPLGITVNAVAPGVIETPMMEQFSHDEKEAMAASTPLGRLGTPADVAKVIRFLATDEAEFITGQIISPNGGLVT
jgi:3-oxoacyl-[acyl-carrier protein] reductase